MKQYVIDQLRPEDREKIKAHLDKTPGPSTVDGVYWVTIAPEMLNDVQSRHEDCQPFYFAMELGLDTLSCELLVRTQKRMRCLCMDYATEAQRNWIIRYTDRILEKNGIAI